MCLYIFLNNSGLQEIWGAVKARLARVQLFAPRKRISPPKPLSLESPRAMQELRSEVSVSRSISILMPSDSPLQSAMPSSFRRPFAHAHLPVAASKPLSPSAITDALNAEVALGGTALFSSPVRAAASRVRAAEAAAVAKPSRFPYPQPESSTSASNAKSRLASGKSTKQGHQYALA